MVQESREAAQLVIEAYGEPQEATESTLIGTDAGLQRRRVSGNEFS
jgi:hypothetical protein